MNLAASALFSLIYSKKGGMTPEMREAMAQAKAKYGNFKVFKMKDGESLTSTLEFDPKELPDRYTKGLKLQKSYSIRVKAGALGKDADNHAAFYTPMGNGRPAGITINLSMLPEIDAIGSVEGVEAALDNLEGAVAHEVQHATQDVVLRKRHPDQMRLPQEGDSEEDYFASDIEFQPQITTANNDFKRMVKMLRNQGATVEGPAVEQLFKVFVGASGQMPQGMLKWKKYFTSPFYTALKSKDGQKWKKAVKELHRLLGA